MMKLPIIVVNLKSETEKKQAMIGEFQKLGIQHYEFLEAVDGKNLSNDEMTKIYDPEKAVEIFERPLVRGEIGCALSHLKIYQKMVDENIEEMIILEDDAKLETDFLKTEQYLAQLPKRWEILFLGYHIMEYMRKLSHQYSPAKNSPFAVPTVLVYCTHAYLINRRGAQKLLAAARPLARAIDHYTGDRKLVNIYILREKSVLGNEIGFSALARERKSERDKMREKIEAEKREQREKEWEAAGKKPPEPEPWQPGFFDKAFNRLGLLPFYQKIRRSPLRKIYRLVRLIFRPWRLARMIYYEYGVKEHIIRPIYYYLRTRYYQIQEFRKHR